MENMCFNAIRENKILTKISEFTVVEIRKRNMFKILEHLPYLSPFLGLVARPRSVFGLIYGACLEISNTICLAKKA